MGRATEEIAGLWIGLTVLTATPAFAARSDLDPTLGGTGTIVLRHSFLDDRACAVTLQPDGKILVGILGGGIPGDFALVRYHPGGARDLTFKEQFRVSQRQTRCARTRASAGAAS